MEFWKGDGRWYNRLLFVTIALWAVNVAFGVVLVIVLLSGR